MTTPAITDQPRLRAGVLRHTGAYHLIGQAFGRLPPILKAAAIDLSTAHLIGIYHDDPATTPLDALRSDAGVLLAPDAPLPEGLAEVFLPAGRYLTARHLGPYDGLPAAWAAAKQALLTGQRRAAGPSYEVYLNTPMTAAPADLITDIYIPLNP